MKAEDILDLIEIRADSTYGVTIQLARNINGGPYWSVRDGEISAGGYFTMEEAIKGWANTIQYVQENDL